MVKKLVCISAILLFVNIYCMEGDIDPIQTTEVKVISSILKGNNKVQEMKLWSKKGKNYVFLLCNNGQIFISDENLSQTLNPAKIDISLTSLRISSFFTTPQWKHIAEPITNEKNINYLPIATDNDVYLAKIIENNDLISLDITKKIISHNSKIHAVQKYNENTIISSSTYPTTKFWSFDKSKKQDLPGYLFLEKSNDHLLFIKDTYQNDKWNRWMDRKEIQRNGTFCVKNYTDSQEKISDESLTFNIIDFNIITAFNNNSSIAKVNIEYYDYNLTNPESFKKYDMPAPFADELANLKQLHVVNIQNDSIMNQYVISVTPDNIYLWQANLAEKTSSAGDLLTYLYSLDLNEIQGKSKSINIQKTVFNTNTNDLYIAYEQDNKTYLCIYSLPKRYSEIEKLNEVTNSKNLYKIESIDLPKGKYSLVEIFVKQAVDTKLKKYYLFDSHSFKGWEKELRAKELLNEVQNKLSLFVYEPDISSKNNSIIFVADNGDQKTYIVIDDNKANYMNEGTFKEKYKQ